VSESSESFLSYCQTIAQELESRVSRIRKFVSHNLTTGTANEVILREFLAAHAPQQFEVGEGFICNPFIENSASRQCDILVYDKNNFPLVYSVGSVKVVLPRAARMVIEVKTALQKADLKSALENIASSKRLNPLLTGMVLAYSSASTKLVLEHLEAIIQNANDAELPTAILLLDKNTLIHRWRFSDKAETSTSLHGFTVREARSGEEGLAVMFLLGLFFLATEVELYHSDVINMLTDILNGNATVE
jgi:hypothetical protein